MQRVRNRGWLTPIAVVAVPPLLLLAANPDVFHLIAGLAGVRRRPLLLCWLLAAFLTLVLAFFRAAGHRPVLSALIVGVCSALAFLILSSPDIRTVRFTRGQMTYAGTVYIPKSDAPARLTTVVLVPGSAAFKRSFYDLWAERIARSGVVVLVIDKRGVGGTTGFFERENNSSRKNLSLLAQDAVAAVDYAATLAEVDSSRLGLVGFSQAGWVAPLAAAMSSKIRFIALISGPAVSVHEEGVWSDWRGENHSDAKFSRAVAERMMDTVTRRGVDARAVLGHLSIPALWLFGTEDRSIPMLASVRAIDSLAHREGKPFTVDTFPGYDHLLIGRSGRVLPRVAPESWVSLIEFLKSR
ncbi:MAG TPA: prolyl oligopeptidase family serine peptidase [Gemmatimonadaceae bacterium]|nr:prolyl oligopeptidase family serine peptidase [Gemmatimonadaceae bacterium]